MAEELFPPEDLLRAPHSPFREVRLGTIRELSGPEWLYHQDTVRAAAVGDALPHFPFPGGQDDAAGQEDAGSEDDTGVSAVAFSRDGPVGTLAVAASGGG